MASEPTNLAGYMSESLDFDGYSVLVDALLENTPALIWPRTNLTFARMRNEPQIAAILAVYFLAIERARWAVDGDGCRDEVTQQIADDVGLPVKGTDAEPTGARRRKFCWSDHLRVSLLDQVYGHMGFEQGWVQTGGMWRLNQVQERMPQTVAELHLNSDGTLASLEQRAEIAGKPPIIKTSNNALVWYVNQREGSNYFGRSMLRPSYPAWLIKDQVMRVHATSIRRFGLGVPGVEAPPGATPAQVQAAGNLAANFKASDHAGNGMPPGFKFTLTGMTGNVPDAVAFLAYLDQQMTRSTLTSLLDMPTSQRGSRALGETIMDVMVYAQQAVADQHAAAATSQIVVPLVDANWGENEPAPQICVGDVGADLELTAQDINFLFQWGALVNDRPLEDWIRQRYGLPPVDEETRAVRAAAPAAAVDPAAEGGETYA